MQLQNELAVRFHVNLLCASYEFKFFTGKAVDMSYFLGDSLLCVAYPKKPKAEFFSFQVGRIYLSLC